MAALAVLVLGLRVAAAPGATTIVSVSSNANQSDHASGDFSVAISADGRFVAFDSQATNLVPGDTATPCTIFTNTCLDVFVHDRQMGDTSRVSVDSAGNPANDDSGLVGVSISGDGRFVAFPSYASNLVPGDTNGATDTFVHDRLTGTTTRVSVDSNGNQAEEGTSDKPVISADGRFVAFVSSASNLAPDNPIVVSEVFVHDRQTGATTQVSVDSAGNPGNSISGAFSPPAISADGRFVAFESLASNLVAGDTNGRSDVFVHDRQTGATTRVSVDSAGNQGNRSSFFSAISGDGRFVAFQSSASNLVAGDTNTCGFSTDPGTCPDVFVHDRQTGTTTRMSVDSAGNQGNNKSCVAPALSQGCVSISGDGRYVAFTSRASNLVAGDINVARQVFVHDRLSGTTTRVSVDSGGGEANSVSSKPAISADGRFVAFESSASNLVAEDTNTCGIFTTPGSCPDVFVHDLGDLDGDGEWDPFDPCPVNSDCDNDGFADAVEVFVGTDPLVSCGPGAWPPDFNDDTRVNLADVFLFRSHFATVEGDPDYDRRLDLNADGRINLADVFILRQYFATQCVP